MLGEPVPAGEPTEWRDREGKREKPERPKPGLDLELLDGVRAEVVGESAARQPEGGQEANEDQRNRRQATAVEPRALSRDRGCRQ
jgi:hypothetical protein